MFGSAAPCERLPTIRYLVPFALRQGVDHKNNESILRQKDRCLLVRLSGLGDVFVSAEQQGGREMTVAIRHVKIGRYMMMRKAFINDLFHVKALPGNGAGDDWM